MHEVIDPCDARLSRDLEALRAATEERLPSLAETDRRLHARLERWKMVKRRMIVAGALVAACGTALAAPRLLEKTPDERGRASRSASSAVDARDAPEATKPARAKRDALRQAIARRAPAVASGPGASDDAKARVSARGGAEPGGAVRAEPPTGYLENKMGPDREQLARFLNDELSPLLAECVAQAAARAPGLAGMYAIGIETLADADLGAIVDVAEPASRNEIADPLFFECVRESAFTLVFPPPLPSGQETLEITGYFGDRPAE